IHRAAAAPDSESIKVLCKAKSTTPYSNDDILSRPTTVRDNSLNGCESPVQTTPTLSHGRRYRAVALAAFLAAGHRESVASQKRLASATKNQETPLTGGGSRTREVRLAGSLTL